MKIYTLVVVNLAMLGFALAHSSAAVAEEGFFVGGAFGNGYLDETFDGNRINSDSSAYRSTVATDSRSISALRSDTSISAHFVRRLMWVEQVFQCPSARLDLRSPQLVRCH